MQLNFAPATADEIERDPERYLALVTDKKPFIFPFRGKDYEISKHELLWLHEEERFLGTIALRYDGDQGLLMNWVGHIGMAVRPSLLQKGYGAKGILKMRELLMKKFKTNGLSSIRASCDPKNKSSRHLIEHFGGKLLREDSDWLLFGIDMENTKS